MQFLLIISASYFTCAFLHVFCIILPYLVILKILGKFRLLENVCKDITLLKMKRSITKLRLSRNLADCVVVFKLLFMRYFNFEFMWLILFLQELFI